jgi:hypothetical protein
MRPNAAKRLNPPERALAASIKGTKLAHQYSLSLLLSVIVSDILALVVFFHEYQSGNPAGTSSLPV